jgi:hypothetical protein
MGLFLTLMWFSWSAMACFLAVAPGKFTNNFEIDE